MSRVRFLCVLAALGGGLTGCGSNPASPGGQAQEMVLRTFDLPGGVKVDMVRVAAGKFTMGSPGSEPFRNSDEGPQHEVTISKAFYLGRHEVTQGQWAAVVGTKPWSGQAGVVENPDHPAVYVAWEDAQHFVARLNAAERDSVYRLPTEAEWEFACRAGTTSTWSAGNDESRLRDYVWYDMNALNAGEDYAHRVGTKLPNAWGLHDMHGNVWECVLDGLRVYAAGPQTDPSGGVGGEGHGLRGGSFNINSPFVRSARRGFFAVAARTSYLGFRLARKE